MKLIQTNDYLLLIDEGTKMKRGDYVICKRNKEIRHCTNKRLPGMFEDDGAVSNQPPSPYCHTQYYDVIAAYYPLTKEAKELDLPLLPNPFKEEIDIEELANKWFENKNLNVYNSYDKRPAFIEGYKAAQSKQFSLEDVKRISYCLRTGFDLNGDRIISTDVEDLIVELSLFTQQLPKEFFISDKFSTFEENLKNGEYKW